MLRRSRIQMLHTRWHNCACQPGMPSGNLLFTLEQVIITITIITIITITTVTIIAISMPSGILNPAMKQLITTIIATVKLTRPTRWGEWVLEKWEPRMQRVRIAH